MTAAVDTNALLALLYEDDHTDASEAELRRAYQDGNVVITSIVTPNSPLTVTSVRQRTWISFLRTSVSTSWSHHERRCSKQENSFSAIQSGGRMGSSVPLAVRNNLLPVRSAVKISLRASILLQISSLEGTRSLMLMS